MHKNKNIFIILSILLIILIVSLIFLKSINIIGNPTSIVVSNTHEQVASNPEVTPTLSLEFDNLSYISEFNIRLGYPLITKDLSIGTKDKEVTLLNYIFNLPGDRNMTENYESTYTEDTSNIIKRFQKENSIRKTGIVDKTTRDTINNLFFWNEYKEHGMELKNTPEWERIKLLPIDITVTKTRCQNDTDKLEAGQNAQCSLAFSIKNNSKEPLPLDTMSIVASNFTDTTKLNGFQVSTDLYRDFYFYSNKIENDTITLKKDVNKNSLLAPNDTAVFEFSAMSLLQTKMDAQFNLNSISTIFGPIKNSINYPVGNIVHYNPIFPVNEIGKIEFSSYEGFTIDSHIVSFHNRVIESGKSQLIGIFSLKNYLNQDFLVKGLIFKVTTEPDILLDSYVETFKLGSIRSDGFYTEPTKKLSKDTFLVYENSYISSGVGGAGFNLSVTPPSGINKIRVDLIGVETEPKISIPSLPIQGIFQTVSH